MCEVTFVISVELILDITYLSSPTLSTLSISQVSGGKPPFVTTHAHVGAISAKLPTKASISARELTSVTHTRKSLGRSEK